MRQLSFNEESFSRRAFNFNIVALLCGPSGSGKNFMQDLLLQNYSHLYEKMQQVTNRPMRDFEKFGKEYLFVNSETMDKLNLIVKTNNNSNSYGSLPIYDSAKINLVIADNVGLSHFESLSEVSRNLFYTSIGLTYENDESRINGRENRDNKVYFKVLDNCDKVLHNNSNKYLSYQDLHFTIKRELKINPDFFEGSFISHCHKKRFEKTLTNPFRVYGERIEYNDEIKTFINKHYLSSTEICDDKAIKILFNTLFGDAKVNLYSIPFNEQEIESKDTNYESLNLKAYNSRLVGFLPVLIEDNRVIIAIPSLNKGSDTYE